MHIEPIKKETLRPYARVRLDTLTEHLVLGDNAPVMSREFWRATGYRCGKMSFAGFLTGIFLKGYFADYPQSVDMPLSTIAAASANVNVDHPNDEYAQTSRTIANTVGNFLTQTAFGTRQLEPSSSELTQDAFADEAAPKPLWARRDI